MVKVQSFNYHAHTKRCGHAIGEDEEYVVEAIRNGYRKIGVSDHIPYPNGYLETDRMHEDEFEEYVESIQRLQQKYAKDIEIRIGLEFEYYPDFEEYLWDMKNRVDYLILGQHDRGLFAPDFYKNYRDKDTELYGKLVVEAIEKGLPDILAHPDLFMYGKEEWTATCEKVAHDICKAAQDHQVLLEVNLNGVKYGKCKRGKETRYLYPYRHFWEIAAQYDVRVIYGLDAHFPQKYSDQKCYDIVNQEVIYDLPLTFVEDLSFDKKI
ncbi:histidinol-phosphatase [Amedibacillus dolichus]|uniref:histidinol-phosphatase n=1 Tax=Amedibacillus dolichus TaxID=31971 RepID=UPI0015F7FD0F|nr:histidinol-phosphatase [Amedibacillus dolichus]MCG4880068.1 histidinol-phosphatase [Amedibacillus dolichus]